MKQQINESVSKIAYHFTDIKAAESILHGNKLGLTMVNKGSADELCNKGYGFYLSLTTSISPKIGYAEKQNNKDSKFKSIEIQKKKDKETGETIETPIVKANKKWETTKALIVRFCFDGDAINANFKGGRVDAIAAAYKKDLESLTGEKEKQILANKRAINKGSNPTKFEFDQAKYPKSYTYGFDIDSKSDEMLSGKTEYLKEDSVDTKNRNAISRASEMEDRVFSNSPTIENLNIYVTNVDIFVPSNNDFNEKAEYGIYSAIKNILFDDTIKSIWGDKIRWFTDYNSFCYGRNDVDESEVEDVVEGCDYEAMQIDESSKRLTEGDLRFIAELIYALSYNGIDKTIDNARAILTALQPSLNFDIVEAYGNTVEEPLTETKKNERTINLIDAILEAMEKYELENENANISANKIKRLWNQVRNQFAGEKKYIQIALLNLLSKWLNKYMKAVKRECKNFADKVFNHPKLLFSPQCFGIIKMVMVNYLNVDLKTIKGGNEGLLKIITNPKTLNKLKEGFQKEFSNKQYYYDELAYFNENIRAEKRGLVKELGQLGRQQRFADLVSLSNGAANAAMKLRESDMQYMVYECIKKIKGER